MRHIFAFAPLFLLAGCSGTIDAPSLAPRAIERLSLDEPPAQAEQVSPADPALAARLAAIVAKAEEGHRTFMERRAQAEAAAARAAGSGQGSDAWLTAQEMLSALDVARTPVQDAEAELDAALVEPANAAAGNRQAIEDASQRINALADEEAAALTALTARLG